MLNWLQPILLGLSLLLLPSQGLGGETSGVKFAERLQLEQAELQLTGSGILTWALVFDVYAGAFYLPAGMAGRDWTQQVPKHLELAYFRSFTADDFISTSDQLLREQLSGEDYQRLAERLQQFYRLFQDIQPGDRYSLTYAEQTGTELRLNGELLGATPGHDFAVAYFGLWLGPQPINNSFRDRLLGG